MVGIHRAGIASGLPTFVSGEPLLLGQPCVLDEAAARHMRVIRLDVGAQVGLRDGHGGVGEGQLIRLTKTQALIHVERLEHRPQLPALHLLLPVADKDRMLWLAEKAAELACTSWRPVMWRRSRSVSPRGEGPSFQTKVRQRMEGALAQSEGAWLPVLFPEATLERAILATPVGMRIVLDPEGEPLISAPFTPLASPVTIAVGPEGGLERDELDALEAAGFRRASIGRTILRFETAAMSAVAIARTSLGAGSHDTALDDAPVPKGDTNV